MTIRTVAATGSTNADMLLLARDDAAEGLWLRADRQTEGKGRLGRAWISEPGNLYASTLVRLRRDDPPPATLALVAAVALHQAVTVFLSGGRASATLKWPNDLLIGAAKLSGILLERSGEAVVVGIGVNLAHHPDLADRPTTSLAAQGVPVAAADFAEVLADGFARWLETWRGQGLGPVRDAWLAAAHPVGTPLHVRLPDGSSRDGLFAGLEPDGALILRLASGERHVIYAADVSVLKD